MKKLILICASVVLVARVAISQDNGEFKTRTSTPKESPKKEKKEKKEDSDDEKAYGEKKLAITIGYGFPNLNTNLFKGLVVNANSFNDPYGDNTYAYKTSSIGPSFLKVDYGLTSLIGLGVSLGYSKINLTENETYRDNVLNPLTGLYSTGTYTDETKYELSKFSIGARINFHFGTGAKLDPYAGVALGYSINQLKISYTTNNPNGPTPANYSGTGIPVHFAITVGMRYYFTKNIGIYGELGIDKWSLIQGGLAFKF